MDRKILDDIFKAVQGGTLSPADAALRLKNLPYEDLHVAKVDHHRELRSGIMEVVYGEGKSLQDVVTIAKSVYKSSKKVLITRTNVEVFKALKIKGAIFHERSRVIEAGGNTLGGEKKGNILVVSAGTSDMPVAEEAAVTAGFLGSRVEMLTDVGVAGLHRVLGNMKTLQGARVIIVVAGMEGALPSVIGGLTDKPLVAVPTSVGYGTSLGGLTALFAMLNSCVPGIAVVNIDNGFGAGCLAHKINMMGL
jgi:hypothetical protein